MTGPATSLGPEQLQTRLAAVVGRIERAGGDPGAVQVLAVTKGFGPDAVVAAAALGLEVGENYAQELLAKRAAAGAVHTRWHFLGALQTNKIRSLAPAVDVFESLSRPIEAERLAEFCPGATVLLELAASADPGRPGCPAGSIGELAATARGLGLAVVGLMVVAPPPPADPRPSFRLLRRLADELGLPVRSMGMTDDLEVAVAEGSTLVRIGRGLFGDRPAGPWYPPGLSDTEAPK